MTWLRFGDEWLDSPTIAALTDGAVLLHMSALSYCTRFDTDGLLPAGSLRGLRCGSQANARRLVAAGLWVERPGGWLLSDYTEHCLTRAWKDAEAERVRQWRARKRGEAS